MLLVSLFGFLLLPESCVQHNGRNIFLKYKAPFSSCQSVLLFIGVEL